MSLNYLQQHATKICNFYVPKTQVLLIAPGLCPTFMTEGKVSLVRVQRKYVNFFPLIRVYRNPEVHPVTSRVRDPDPENQSQTQWNDYSDLPRALLIIAQVLLEKQQLMEPLKFRKLNSNLLIGKHQQEWVFHICTTPCNQMLSPMTSFQGSQ